MPELPEVETTLRGIEPLILNKTISSIIVRQASLRWPVPARLLKDKLISKNFSGIRRRGKYLILQSHEGFLIIHLGMSGSLRVAQEEDLKKHDHIDVKFEDESILRYCDPRRFGCFLWTENPNCHFLLKNLGKADITSNVNFALLKEFFLKNRFKVKKIVSQKDFLKNMGIIERAEIISKKMKFTDQTNLYLRLKRLMSPRLMGEIFKVFLAYKINNNNFEGFK